MREEWPKNCDVITFCINSYGFIWFSFHVESIKDIVMFPSSYNIQTSTLSSVNHLKHTHMGSLVLKVCS